MAGSEFTYDKLDDDDGNILKPPSSNSSYYSCNNCVILHVPDEDRNSSDPEYQLYFLSDGESDDTEHYPQTSPGHSLSRNASGTPVNSPEIQQNNPIPRRMRIRSSPSMFNSPQNEAIDYLNLDYPSFPQNSNFESSSNFQSSVPQTYFNENEDLEINRNNFHRPPPPPFPREIQQNTKIWNIEPPANRFFQNNNLDRNSRPHNENIWRRDLSNNVAQETFQNIDDDTSYQSNNPWPTKRNHQQQFRLDKDELAGYKSEGEINYGRKAELEFGRSKKYTRKPQNKFSFNNESNSNKNFSRGDYQGHSNNFEPRNSFNVNNQQQGNSTHSFSRNQFGHSNSQQTFPRNQFGHSNSQQTFPRNEENFQQNYSGHSNALLSTPSRRGRFYQHNRPPRRRNFRFKRNNNSYRGRGSHKNGRPSDTNHFDEHETTHNIGNRYNNNNNFYRPNF